MALTSSDAWGDYFYPVQAAAPYCILVIEDGSAIGSRSRVGERMVANSRRAQKHADRAGRKHQKAQEHAAEARDKVLEANEHANKARGKAAKVLTRPVR